MPEDFGLGSISRTRLPINFNNNQTVWYIPMYNYDGTIYVSQINSVGSLAASCVLNVNALTSVSTTMSGGATAGSNIASGPNNGLQFTGIDLRYYSLVVMFVGTNAGTEAGYFKFQGNNPANPSYTLTSGTAPTVAYLNNTYTSLSFYYNGSITFQNPVTLQGSTGNSYASYILSGTNPTNTANSNNGSSGATCVYMRSNATSTTSYLTATINNTTTNSHTDCSLTTSAPGVTPPVQFSSNVSINSTNGLSSPFNSYFSGGAGSNSYSITSTTPWGSSTTNYFGVGGGSAGPHGPGGAAYQSTVGAASSYNGYTTGLPGQGATNYPGVGGGAKRDATAYYGNTGAVVAIIPGHLELSIPGPG